MRSACSILGILCVLFPSAQVSSQSAQTPASSVATAQKLSLPHPIEDDSYVAALARFHATVPRFLRGNYHSHTDVRMVDLDGRESSATIDHWVQGRRSRIEEQALGYHWVVVWNGNQSWQAAEGIPPMRLLQMVDLYPRPFAPERRIRVYGVLQKNWAALKPATVDGAFAMCTADYAGGTLCFDRGSGFPLTATVDNETVRFKEWSQWAGASFPSRITLSRSDYLQKDRLQMEANTTVIPLTDPGTLLDPLPNVDPTPAQYGFYREVQHRILSRGQVNRRSFGMALVKVSVNTEGRVLTADLLDADDKFLAAEALAAARKTIYLPQEDRGHNVPFETSFQLIEWSTLDPLNNSATSRLSQSPD